jgi:hypothetical protein
MPRQPAPDLAFVLGHRQDLALTRRQAASLGAIQRRWQTETAALQEALDRAASRFGKCMDEQEGQRGMPRAVPGSAGELSGFSQQLAATRRAAWEEAAQLLTPYQRQQAEALWHEHMSGRLRPGNTERSDARIDPEGRRWWIRKSRGAPNRPRHRSA